MQSWLNTMSDVLIAGVFVLFLLAAVSVLVGYIWSIGNSVRRIVRARRN